MIALLGNIELIHLLKRLFKKLPLTRKNSIPENSLKNLLWTNAFVNVNYKKNKDFILGNVRIKHLHWESQGKKKSNRNLSELSFEYDNL